MTLLQLCNWKKESDAIIKKIYQCKFIFLAFNPFSYALSRTTRYLAPEHSAPTQSCL